MSNAFLTGRYSEWILHKQLYKKLSCQGWNMQAMKNWVGVKISGAAEWHFPVVGFKRYKRYIWNSDVLKVKILLEAKMR